MIDGPTDTPISRRAALGAMGAAAAATALRPIAARADRRVEGRVALVTGSSSGLGYATVLELASRGADVVVNGRSDRDAAESVAAECEALGVRAIPILADVGVEEQVDAMVREALAAFGRIDILINNAAYRGQSPITEMSTEDWRAATAANHDGPFFCSRAVVPGMIANEYGRIITVSGLNSFHGRTGWAHVCASKMGAVGLTRALAAELGPYNILVNHVVPGAFAVHPDVDAIPQGRLGLPEELANVYAFLSSEDCSYVTGQTFHVNGGDLRY